MQVELLYRWRNSAGQVCRRFQVVGIVAGRLKQGGEEAVESGHRSECVQVGGRRSG